MRNRSHLIVSALVVSVLFSAEARGQTAAPMPLRYNGPVFDVAGMPFDSEALFPYYEVAQELAVPVFIHTGFSGPNPQQLISPAFRIGVANPILLESVLREAVAAAGSERILFGSLQMAWPSVIERSVSAVQEADYLQLADKRAILWGNAARLLRLE